MITEQTASCGGSSNTPAQRTDRTNKIKVLIDWVGFTFLDENTSLDAVLRLFWDTLQIDFTEWKPGRQNYQGYANSLTFENINIYFGGQADQGIHVDITGQGCRFLELKFKKLGVQLNESPVYWYHFLKILRVQEEKKVGKFTRIDIAIDDHGQHFSVPYIFQKCLAGELTSKFKSWSPDGYFGMDGQAKQGMTMYFGSDFSRIQIVMYEKGKQLGLENDNWTRTEIRYKHERAEEFVDTVLEQTEEKQYDIGVIAAGHLKEYITFRDPNPNDTNKRRWPVSPFWDMFLEGIEPLRLASALPDRSILRMRSWINHQVSKAIATLYFAYQGINDDWLAQVLHDGKKKMTSRELALIQEYRDMFVQETAVALDSAIDITQSKKEYQTAPTVDTLTT